MENLIFYMAFSDRGMIWNTIRSLFSWFDSIVYTILGWFFQTIFYVANFQMNILYEEMQARVYVVLGIFMLFKLVISFLSYLVNPDKISDKEQGIGKVATRVIVVLIMFLALPTFFNIMTELQNRLLPVIPRIIIGQAAGGDFFHEDSETGVTTMDVSDMGQVMALSVYRAFLRTNTSSECSNVELVEADSGDPTVSIWTSIEDATDHINDPCPNNKDKYLYTYTPIIPFIVGIIMVVVVLGINLDVGIRSFKLLILRAIAPIPILSYIDPKSSKDGAFSKWTKMLFSTWLSLFINLGIVYLVIYLIQMLFRADVWANFFGNLTSPNPVINAIVLILVVIALLFFAREAPQFIMDALGIKSTGSFGKMLGMAAAGLGMAGSARASYQASRDADEALDRGHGFLNTAKNIGAGLFGGISGGMAGAHAALNAKDHYMQASRDAISKRNATAIARGAAGSTVLGRANARMQMLFGGETEYDRMNRELTDNKEANSAIGAWISGSKQKALDADDHGPKGILVDVGGHTGLNYKTLKQNIESAQKGDQAAMQYLIDKGFAKTVDVEEEFQEEYDVPKQVGTGIYGANGKEIMKTVYEKATRTATRTVQKQVGDWQSAFSILTDVEDKQVNEHMYRIASENYTDIDGNVQEGGSSYDGANYDKYERATHAMKGLTAKDKDGNTFNIEFTVGNTNNELLKSSKKMAGATTDNQRNIEQNHHFEAAKVDAKEAKKN